MAFHGFSGALNMFSMAFRGFHFPGIFLVFQGFQGDSKDSRVFHMGLQKVSEAFQKFQVSFQVTVEGFSVRGSLKRFQEAPEGSDGSQEGWGFVEF